MAGLRLLLEPHAEHVTVLEESQERTDDPEGMRADSTQTPGD